MLNRKTLTDLGWLNKDENPLSVRLKYDFEKNINLKINDKNRELRNNLLKDIKEGKNKPVDLPCPLGGTVEDDVLISEYDGFGIPLRTVINKITGLIRSTPYYSSEWLGDYYAHTFRKLYNVGKNLPKSVFFLSGKIKRSEDIYSFIEDYLDSNAKVLEVGCSMGGILLPFKMRGHSVTGIDFGEENIKYGKHLGLDLRLGGFEQIKADEKFDLVIVSHVLEHVPDIDDFLQSISKVLSNKGILYIEVPGIEMIKRDYNNDLLLYLQNSHCWHFTANTLNAVMAKNNYKCIKINDEVRSLYINGNPEKINLLNEFNTSLNKLHKFEKEFEKGRNRMSRIKQRIRNLLRRAANSI